MVVYMTRFVYRTLWQDLKPEVSIRDDGLEPWDADLFQGLFYSSFIRFDAEFDHEQADYPLIGYKKTNDIEASASGGNVWQMPIADCLRDKAKEVWALLRCDYAESYWYSPHGPQTRAQGNNAIHPSDYGSAPFKTKTAYRLVKCAAATSQDVSGGSYLYVPASDVSGFVSTLMNDAGVYRWSFLPGPPSDAGPEAWKVNGWQQITCQVADVFPVWTCRTAVDYTNTLPSV